jgi:hypothetical protein
MRICYIRVFVAAALRRIISILIRCEHIKVVIRARMESDLGRLPLIENIEILDGSGNIHDAPSGFEMGEV